MTSRFKKNIMKRIKDKTIYSSVHLESLIILQNLKDNKMKKIVSICLTSMRTDTFIRLVIFDDEILQKLIEEADRDKDGSLYFNHFKFMMTQMLKSTCSHPYY